MHFRVSSSKEVPGVVVFFPVIVIIPVQVGAFRQQVAIGIIGVYGDILGRASAGKVFLFQYRVHYGFAADDPVIVFQHLPHNRIGQFPGVGDIRIKQVLINSI